MDLFAFKLNYNTVNQAHVEVEPLYNGNIAQTFWITANDNIKRSYGYVYDHLNRLRDAYYKIPYSSVNDSYNEHLTYDSNGNILSLTRNGKEETDQYILEIDELAYNYDDGNKLLNVTDATAYSEGFNDGNKHGITLEDDFEYDLYGNLVKDRNKNISEITYNHLNLPKKITYTNNDIIEYLYDANGIKLKKTVKVNGNPNHRITHYADGFQYSGNSMDFFPTAEGYVNITWASGTPGGPQIPTYNYVYNYTDHLGNIRLRYTKNPGTGGGLRILEEDHYYPFGLKHKGYNGEHEIFEFDEQTSTVVLNPVNPLTGDKFKYKFGNKELQEELGLNIYDFGFRNYQPDLGRWFNIDPLAEQMRRHSPYNYAFNNPVFFIDPDGMAPFGSNCDGCPSPLERIKQGFSSFFSGLSQTVSQYFNDKGYDTSSAVGVTAAKNQTDQERLANYSEGGSKISKGVTDIAKGSVQGAADVTKETAEAVSEASSYTTIVTGGASAPITIPLQKGADVVAGGAGLVSASIDASDGNYEAAGDKVIEAGTNAAFGKAASKVSKAATKDISTVDGKEVQQNVMETVMGWFKDVTEMIITVID